MPPPPPLADGLRLRRDVWRRHCSASGAITLSDKAILLGVSEASISRIERGSSPSDTFIARALDALAGITFLELFETVYEAAA